MTSLLFKRLKINTGITTAFGVVVMSLFAVSCQKKEQAAIAVKFDPNLIPTMITDSVSTLISDSGVTRYRLQAPLWEVFDRASDPYWYFPKGLHAEQFDDNYHTEITIGN